MQAAVMNPGTAYPVFVAGIKYPSLFQEQAETGISQTSFSIALKKHNGEPCKIKRNVVVLEAWVISRMKKIKG
jgi:hypothetical protein